MIKEMQQVVPKIDINIDNELDIIKEKRFKVISIAHPLLDNGLLVKHWMLIFNALPDDAVLINVYSSWVDETCNIVVASKEYEPVNTAIEAKKIVATMRKNEDGSVEFVEFTEH